MTTYDQILGFRCEYSGGTPPEFAICSRGGFSIMLRKVTEPERILPNEKQGATIVYGPLIQEAYQMKEFAIRDSDGHVLGFGEILARDYGAPT